MTSFEFEKELFKDLIITENNSSPSESKISLTSSFLQFCFNRGTQN